MSYSKSFKASWCFLSITDTHYQQVNNLPVATLRYLATVDLHQTIAIEFRWEKSMVNQITRRLCEVIWNELKAEYIRFPTVKVWKDIAHVWRSLELFSLCWAYWWQAHSHQNADSESDCYNYKSFSSIVLQAVVDARCWFVMVDIGAFGRESDAGILTKSCFGMKLFSGGFDLPKTDPFPRSQIVAPYVFVGDDAFPIRENMMRSYLDNVATFKKNDYVQ